MRSIRALLMLHRTFSGLPIGQRLHVLIRFLTCPLLRVLEHVPPGSSLLDIGAGHGLFARLAVDHGSSRVVGVEPDLRKVRAIAGASLIAGFDACVRGTHDVVSIIDVLYKIPIDDWDGVLLRVASRLPDGGLLLIKEQDPTARVKNGWNRLQEWMASTAGLTLGESFSYEDPGQFVRRLERTGFAEIRVERIDRWYPHPHILYIARKRPAERPA